MGSTKESADGTIWLARSVDLGKNWQHWPLSIDDTFEGVSGEFHYGPLTLLSDNRILIALMWTDRSNPDLPFFNPETEGLLPIRTIFGESADGGRTWGNIRGMDLAPYQSPMPITGSVLKFPGGAACLPV